jgi:hypothetical protein
VLYKLDFNAVLAYFIYLLCTFHINFYVCVLHENDLLKRAETFLSFSILFVKALYCNIVLFGIFLNFYS